MTGHKLPPNFEKDEFLGEPPITPPEGGVFTPIHNWAFPYKGHPPEITVEILATIKGIIPIGLKFIEQSVKKGDLIALWNLKNHIYDILQYGGKILNRRLPLYSKRFNRPTRELYRVLTIPMEKIQPVGKPQDYETRLKWSRWLDLRAIVCITSEFDNAYRYRIQDFLIEMNKEQLQKHPIKELRRLLSLMIKRENRASIAIKWKRLKLILTILLLLKPKIKKQIVELLMAVNQDEIQFEDDDWYMIAMRTDYNFGGLTNEDVLLLKNFQRSESKGHT